MGFVDSYDDDDEDDILFAEAETIIQLAFKKELEVDMWVIEKEKHQTCNGINSNTKTLKVTYVKCFKCNKKHWYSTFCIRCDYFAEDGGYPVTHHCGNGSIYKRTKTIIADEYTCMTCNGKAYFSQGLVCNCDRIGWGEK